MHSTEIDDQGHMIWAPEHNGEEISSRTYVWWDMESCPFAMAMAGQSDWNTAAQILVQKLRLDQYHDPKLDDSDTVSVATLIGYGNGDVPDPLLAALQMCGINVHRRILPACMVPGAESSVTIMSMIVDLLFWALNNAPPAQVRIICAAEDKNFRKLIRGLYRRSYDVVIMTTLSAFSDSPIFKKCGSYPTPTTYDDESAHHHHLTNYWNSFLERIQMPHHDHHNPSNNQCSNGSLHVFGFPCPHQEAESSMPDCLTYKDVAAHGRRSSLVTLTERGCKTAAASPNTTTSSPRNSDENLAAMEDVRSWLEGFVASNKCLFGMDISLMAKSMEVGLGKKLDLKLLGFPSLTRLLVATCADLVRLKHPSKDRTHMFPVKLCGEARVKMTEDFHLLLAEILPKKDDKFPLSHVKSAFKAKFQYDLDHEAVGYSKLHQFVGSMPKLVRLHRSSSVLLNELVIKRPSRYWRNNKCEISSELSNIITPRKTLDKKEDYFADDCGDGD